MKWFKWACGVFVLTYVISAYPSHYALTRRLIQVLAMILVSVFAVSATLVTQSITQNKLMTPSVLGIDRLYLFLSVLASIIPISWFLKLTLVIGLSVLFYFRMLRIFENKLMLMLLVGMCVAGLFSALTSSLMLMMDPNEYTAVQMSLQASFNGLRLEKILSGGLIGLIGFVIYLSMHKQHDVMTLGYDVAHNLGINIRKFQFLSIVSVILMVASVSAMVGPVSILGLLCINLVKHNKSLKQCTHASVIAMGIILLSHIIFEKVLGLNGSLTYVMSILGGLSFILAFIKEDIDARYQSSIKNL